jgi:hypothetical protein
MVGTGLASCGTDGPEACVAAGGKCLLGPGLQCAKVGPQDCNPEINPGGAFCCLEEISADAGKDATAAPDGGQDATATADASDASDASHASDAADSAPYCSAPISAASPATLSDVPIADLCASNANRVYEWTCGGFTSVTIGVGVDCAKHYFFDAGSKRLVAFTQGCVGSVCVEGNADFALPTDCLAGNIPFQTIALCGDGG